MAQAREAQLNVRSRFAKQRAAYLAKATGMTTTQVVEEALRAYSPPVPHESRRLERRGRLLVMTGGRPVTHEDAEAAIEAVRNERE